MNRLLSAMALALTLALSLNASAQDGDKTKAENDQGSAERQTIRGTVAGVTVVGETMIDYETNRAAVAQVSYLTILGSPRRGDAHRETKGADPQKSRDAGKESSAESEDEGSGNGSQGGTGSAQRRRPNVYLVAITPQTKVCEDRGDDSSAAKSSAGQNDQTQSRAMFERLELGDRVEVEFRSEGATSRKSMNRGHGRHRTFRGVATAITILPELDGDDNPGPGSSSEKDDQPSKQDDNSSGQGGKQ